jgi:trehalose/maltose transport system permease protein
MANSSAGGGLILLHQRQRAAFWFLAPMLTALFSAAARPLLQTVWFSFTDTSLNNLYGGKWIGFDNYMSVRMI